MNDASIMLADYFGLRVEVVSRMESCALIRFRDENSWWMQLI